MRVRGGGERCNCSELDLKRYERRLSGPLLDRMDLLVNVSRPSEEALRERSCTTSAAARDRVASARERQQRRLRGTGATVNAELDAGMIQSRVRIDEAAHAALAGAYLSGRLSARGRHRVLRVARTVADLGGRERVSREDVLVALSLRQQIGVSSPEGL